MKPISLVVITLNAEEHIERCLKSVPFAADLVVVDSGSTDRTRELAAAAGARVFEEKWRGFGPQKHYAAELAKTDWILSLDADEALSTEAQTELRAWQNSAEDTAPAYAYPRLSYHMGRWIRHGGWYPDRQIRLFDRTRANWNDAVLHEKIVADRVERMKAPILHWVFRDLTDQVATNNKYSGLGTDKLIEKRKRFSLFHLVTKPWVKFIECYIIKLGFLDGVPGFIIAVGASYSVFLKWAKLWERQKKRSAPSL